MKNNKYYEPWNERSYKFQRKDDHPYVPFQEETNSDGMFRTSVVYGVFAFVCLLTLTFKEWL
jgi:hypothetical protein